MNIACSICLELFDSRSDISTTPCGHVFHTDCIKNWMESGQNNCSQCRKGFSPNQIIKLYFSERESENDIVVELTEANRKLQEDAILAESKCLKIQKENLKIQEEKLKLKDEKRKLLYHFDDLNLNSKNIEMALREKNENLKKMEEKVSQLEWYEWNRKKQNPDNDPYSHNDIADYHEIYFALEKGDEKTCIELLDKTESKNPRYDENTALHLAAAFG